MADRLTFFERSLLNILGQRLGRRIKSSELSEFSSSESVVKSKCRADEEVHEVNGLWICISKKKKKESK